MQEKFDPEVEENQKKSRISGNSYRATARAKKGNRTISGCLSRETQEDC